MSRFYFLALLLIFLVSSLPSQLTAQGKIPPIEAEQIIWGFDGTVFPGRFNQLSVKMVNNSNQPYQGMLTLKLGKFTTLGVGAPIMTRLYLSPQSQKWVHLSPYIRGQFDDWSLSWTGGSKDLPDLIMGGPSTVFLYDSRTAFFQKYRIKTLPDNLFPTSTALTDNLSALVLDYTPVWKGARRKTFLNWLHSGGTLHLCHNEKGEYPLFVDDLATLNSNKTSYRYGAGFIHKHALKGPEISAKHLSAVTTNSATVKKGGNSYLNFDKLVFAQLTKLVDPNHSWGVISLLLVIYTLLLIPGCFIYARKFRRGPGKSITAYLTIIVVFTIAIKYIGQRGYGESSSINTLSLARSLGNGNFDVSQWTQAFFTSGDTYQFQDPGEHSLYSTCEEHDSIRAQIFNGPQGGFVADIPLYSSRLFLHRAQHKLKTNEPTFSSFQLNNNGDLDASLNFEQLSEKPLKVWAAHNNKYYTLTAAENGDWKFSEKSKTENQFFNNAFNTIRNTWGHSSEESNDDIYNKLHKPLIAHALGGISQQTYYIDNNKGDATIDVFVLLPQPTDVMLKGEKLGKEEGQILYHFKLAEPALDER